MTLGLDSQNLESYVPVYDVIPESWEDARPFIVEQLKKITNSLNTKEIGFFLDQELLSGKAFIPGVNQLADGGSSQQFRTILRKVVDFGTLPNNATKTVAHEIMFDNNFTLIALWAAATDPTNFISFQIPFVAQTVTTSIALLMDATNFIITTHDDKTSFTRCFVICEYIQEL